MRRIPLKFSLVQLAVVFIFLTALVACNGSTTTPATPTPVPPRLSFNEYPLKQPPEPESLLLYFADPVQGDPRLLHASERSKVFAFFDSSCTYMNGLGRCVNMGPDKLIAQEEFNNDGSGGTVSLTRNDETIYEIPIGPGSPIDGLRGLWVYGDHWVLETAYITQRSEGDTIYSDAVGQVTLDGVLLNDKFGYEEAFGFQTIQGKPFYFYKLNGKIDAWYDGNDIPLGYDKILHYGCCSAATLNPHMSQNMVAFFAQRGDTWYYAEIGVFGDQK